MAKASEQFRQSDVVRWSVVALVSCALAVLAANVSALLPQGILSGLHSSRIEGVSLEQLRVAVAGIEEQSRALRSQNATMAARFSQHEHESSQAVRRIGALEVSLPRLIEERTAPPELDRSLPTASIGATLQAPVLTPAEGGSVRIETAPMVLVEPDTAGQPLPDVLSDTVETGTLPAIGNLSFGIALGPSIAPEAASASWGDLQTKLGPLLLGLDPVIASQSDGTDYRIIAGPTANLAEARTLCARLDSISIPCEPMPYIGLPLD